MSNNTTV